MVSQYKYDVDMSCGACCNAINKVLGRMDGVERVDINLEQQFVLVDADSTRAPYDAVLRKIQNTGRNVKGGQTVHG